MIVFSLCVFWIFNDIDNNLFLVYPFNYIFLEYPNGHKFQIVEYQVINIFLFKWQTSK